MSRLKRPYDKLSAKELMKKFSDLAYSVSHLEIFQEAVHILYGREFSVTVDLSKRMQFSCQICNREMNSENAMAEHFRSGAHQKNLDKKTREMGETNFSARASNYASDSIHFKLLNSHITPVGLQMIEEYINKKGTTYFKCFICGAHGKMDTMYHHIIGKKHTEKYIKSGCILENSILTSNEREDIRQKLARTEGVNVDAIKTIRGDAYYPYKWEAEGYTSKIFNQKIKKEQRSLSRSPSPGPSGRQSVSRRRSVSRSMSSSRSRSHSRCRSYSRKESRSRSRSRSVSQRPSRSPYSSKKSKSKKKKRRYPSSSSSSDDNRRSRSYSPIRKRKVTPEKRRESPEIPMKMPLQIPRCSVARDVGDLYQFRNRSPPSLSRVKLEPRTPMVHSQSLDNQLREPPPALPVDLQTVKKETKDKEVQTKLDLDDLMNQLNFLVRTHQTPTLDTSLKTPDDVKQAIDLMAIIAESLRQLSVTVLDDPSFKSAEKKKQLLYQKEKREKITVYVSKWYLPTWHAEQQTRRRL